MFCIGSGAENPDSGTFCWSCGNKLSKNEGRPQSNTAVSAPTRPAAARDGAKLIVPRDAVLPSACVKCAAAGVPRSYKFAWLSPGYYGLLVLGILPYFVLRFFLRKTATLLVPLCDRHRRRTHGLGVAAAVTLIAAVPVGFIVAAILGEPDGVIWGSASSFFGVLTGLVLLWARDPLRAVHIDGDQATFIGACEGFLLLLPFMPSSPTMNPAEWLAAKAKKP